MRVTQIPAILIVLWGCTNTHQPGQVHLDSLTFRSYTGIDTGSFEFPYIVHVQHNTKEVLVYGGHHFFDPGDPMATDIKEKFENFKPGIVFNEGGEWPIYPTLEESIQKSSEMGMVRHLAREQGVPYHSIEPSPEQEYQFVLEHFKKEHLILRLFIYRLAQREMGQVQAGDGRFDLGSFYADFVSGLENEGLSLTEKEKQPEYIKNTYRDFFNEKFDVDSVDYNTVIYNNDQTVLNRIGLKTAEFRDRHFVQVIADSLQKYNKIYFQVGGWHAFTMEPALETVVGRSSGIRQ